MNRGKIADLDEYQRRCSEHAQWTGPGASKLGGLPPVIYCALGCGGEAGELLDKIKKLYRDREGHMTPEDARGVMLELGDLLWYIGQLAAQMGWTLSDVAQANLDKLADRRARGVLRGAGDNR